MNMCLLEAAMCVKNAEAAISCRRGDKKFKDWRGGVKKFRNGGYRCRGISTPLHAMLK